MMSIGKNNTLLKEVRDKNEKNKTKQMKCTILLIWCCISEHWIKQDESCSSILFKTLLTWIL